MNNKRKLQLHTTGSLMRKHIRMRGEEREYHANDTFAEANVSEYLVYLSKII
jgi:hypothetical protein